MAVPFVRVAKDRCEQKPCRRRAIVGLGSPPRWLCLRHFNDALEGSFRAARLAAQAAIGRLP